MSDVDWEEDDDRDPFCEGDEARDEITRLRDLVAAYENTVKFSDAELIRLSASNAKLLSTCQKLCEEQRYFDEHAHYTDGMPGNEFYSDKFMVVVRMAREAIAHAQKSTK